MRLSRDWATPLTMGAFALMATTGILMFFHLDSGFNKVAHEWLSWVMVGAVALHATVNWTAFKRHVLDNRGGRAIIAVALVVLACSFIPNPSARPGASPPMLALRAVMAAPVKDVAPLAGRSADELLAALRAGGFAQATADTRLDDLAQRNRDREAAILNIAFGGRPR
ncbi:MAG: DUF4405 domain-containing protein [Proteobacteria bacterium]|nr:DUF4405 domain-containing protein [Pseudomonadota bacterium]